MGGGTSKIEWGKVGQRESGDQPMSNMESNEEEQEVKL
jgi:hypothetical protein